MNIVTGFVLFSIIWFLTLFVALPIGVRTQGEAGEVVPGTPASAPTDAMIPRKMLWVTLVAVAIWSAVAAVIVWGGIGIEDIDWFHRM